MKNERTELMKKILKLIMIAVVIAGAAWGIWMWRQSSAQTAVKYDFRTDEAVSGRIARTISASGTVEPEELVNVGSQVTGKIMSFGKDADGSTVDYRSKVKKGMILAQIDDVLYAAELRQRKAEKLQAEAAIVTANAKIKQAEAKLQLAKLNWTRAQNLYSKNAMAKSDYDSAESIYITALADRAAANASLKQAEAQLAIAEAALIKAQRNMDYCVITSPVDGIIIDRRVSIGQTVVSNMSVSSIFLIAKEFDKMQIWVSVNEADIGSIREGLDVEFTVDAFPNTVFKGKVKKVRLNATMSQNVVTYIVEVDTDNRSGKLLPYLTANVKFILSERANALNISSAALRFTPPEECVSASGKAIFEAGAPEGSRFIWIEEEGSGKLAPVAVKTGLNAGGRVEILDGNIKVGDNIVIAASEQRPDRPAMKSGQPRSPFMPTPPKRQPRGAGSAAKRARSEQNSR